MSLKIVVNLGHLFRLAKDMNAVKNDPVAYALAKQEHDTYKEICLKADSLTLPGLTQGDI